MNTVAIVSLVISALCALIILMDVLRHPQRMKVMNVVWPITALYALAGTYPSAGACVCGTLVVMKFLIPVLQSDP